MWSPVERTALADAEVEYHDHVSPTIWVKFPVVEGSDAARGASVVIWTTTPWTIPANRAVSYNDDIAYAVYRVQAIEEGLEFAPWAKAGDRLILAEKLADDVMKAAKVARFRQGSRERRSGRAWCCLPSAGGARRRLRLPGADAGRRPRHRRRRHGLRPHRARPRSGRLHGLAGARPPGDSRDRRSGRSFYYPGVPLFAGLKVLETEGKKVGKFGPANGAVMDKLIEGRDPAGSRPRGTFPIRTAGGQARR